MAFRCQGWMDNVPFPRDRNTERNIGIQIGIQKEDQVWDLEHA